MAIDPLLHHVRVVRGTKSTAVDADAGSPSLRGLHFVRIEAGWQLEDVRRVLRAHLSRNEVDELVVAADDGTLYLVYADELPKALRHGRRFESDELSGEIVFVRRDDQPLKKQARRAAAERNSEAAHSTFVDRALGGPEARLRGELRQALLGSAAGDPTVHVPRELAGYDVFRSAFDPKNALTPPKSDKRR